MTVTNKQTLPWWQTTDFDFIRIPKELFRNPYYASLSPEGKLLYGFLLDRASLSWKSGVSWRNAQGDPFVIFTIEEICQRLHCADKKATRLLRSLVEHALIRLSRPKRDGPYHIVVLPFVPSKQPLPSRQNNDCAAGKTAVPHPSEQRQNKTEKNITQINHTDTIRKHWEYEFKKNIDYDILCMELPREQVDSILEVMVDAVSGSSPTLWIAGQLRSKDEVQKRLTEVDCMHIRYIFDHMKRCNSTVQSYRTYYLARLWDTPGMVDAFYETWVQQDLR